MQDDTLARAREEKRREQEAPGGPALLPLHFGRCERAASAHSLRERGVPRVGGQGWAGVAEGLRCSTVLVAETGGGRV
eukprot:scaffold324008_cov68-Tisochrysis_lutea.AAC.1